MRLSLAVSTLALASAAAAWNTYVVPHTDGADDSPALVAALATGNFSANATILFQKGKHYNIWTPIKFPVFTNVEIAIEGNLSYPLTIQETQDQVGLSTFAGHWFWFAGGTNVTLRGTTDPKWGWVDGHGQQWWNIRQQVNRPHGWAFRAIKGGEIRDMKLYQPVAWSFSLSGSSNVRAHRNTIIAVSNDPDNAFPFNTDGFAAGGTNLTIENNHVKNGDDCVTVGSGARNVVFRNNYCYGGHGLSVGSLGKGGAVADVQNILFENIVMDNCLYAARFKSWTGGNGLARNITWRNIVYKDVPFPIFVTQNYWDQNLGPKPDPPASGVVNNTHIEDILFENFAGVIDDRPDYYEGTCISDPCWYFVPNATSHEIAILDLYPGTATNILVKRATGITRTLQKLRVMCDPTTLDAGADVGFKCWNGLFLPTKKGLF